MKNLLALSLCLSCASVTPAMAQQGTADQIARLLAADMSPTGAMQSGKWFTNPASTQALGVIYVHIPGSAGSVSIHAGIYSYFDSGWVKTQDVDGLFGYQPTDVAFFSDRIEVTTLTLGPGEPRCCPTQRTRWAIDMASGATTRMN